MEVVKGRAGCSCSEFETGHIYICNLPGVFYIFNNLSAATFMHTGIQTTLQCHDWSNRASSLWSQAAQQCLEKSVRPSGPTTPGALFQSCAGWTQGFFMLHIVGYHPQAMDLWGLRSNNDSHKSSHFIPSAILLLQSTIRKIANHCSCQGHGHTWTAGGTSGEEESENRNARLEETSWVIKSSPLLLWAVVLCSRFHTLIKFFRWKIIRFFSFQLFLPGSCSNASFP